MVGLRQTWRLGGLKLRLIQGDLFEVDLAAIVNSEQTDFVLAGNEGTISSQIRRRLGLALQRSSGPRCFSDDWQPKHRCNPPLHGSQRAMLSRRQSAFPAPASSDLPARKLRSRLIPRCACRAISAPRRLSGWACRLSTIWRLPPIRSTKSSSVSSRGGQPEPAAELEPLTRKE
jgi:hypothetical protein